MRYCDGSPSRHLVAQGSIVLHIPDTVIERRHKLCIEGLCAFVWPSHCLQDSCTPAMASGNSQLAAIIQCVFELARPWIRWRVYAPRSAEEVLPRFSSQDFRQENLGEPVLETELRPGSLLYMPRGELLGGLIRHPGLYRSMVLSKRLAYNNL